MTRYKITADNLNRPITLHAESDTEAWELAKKIYLKIADKRLLNGKVTPIMEEAEKDARIAELEEALVNLTHRAAKDAEKYAPDGNEPIWAFIADAADAIAKTKTP
jgi:hypothetical protein